jgi:DnaJ-class molecular chaperone
MASVAAADLQSPDYYENLGVARTATEQKIKTAYVLVWGAF